jgi:DNA-binding LacI/PurR family transcriptional regulator
VFIGHFHREEIEARIADLIVHGTPHLVIDQFGLKNANTVSLDRAAGMEAVMNHLLDHGHRTFGLVGVAKAPVSRHDRLTGIHAALRARGLDFNACTLVLDHLHERGVDFDFGRLLATSFAQLARPPTALLALNDEMGIGVLRGLQDAGLKLPRDMSVTGFNNQAVSLMSSPSLTTVDQNIDATVAAAAEVILLQHGSPPGSKPIIRLIPPKLIVRESTGPARKS